MSVYIDLSLESELPPGIYHAVLAIVREALANTAAHSNATRIDISFKEGMRYYQLLITDNGTQIQKRASHGIGLYNMEERIQRLGGDIRFSQSRGFRIFARIPLSVAEDQGNE